MFKKIAKTLLCLLSCLSVAAPALADAPFAAYVQTVQGLDAAKAQDAQHAAQAFITYVQAAVKGDRAGLLEHMDYPLLVDGKTVNKADVAAGLDRVFNAHVARCVAGANPKDEVFVRQMVEYMIGDGCVWFTFADDKAETPVIFAVNTSPVE